AQRPSCAEPSAVRCPRFSVCRGAGSCARPSAPAPAAPLSAKQLRIRPTARYTLQTTMPAKQTAVPTRPALAAQDLHKRFRIPEERRHTLKERVLHPLRRTRHEELHALKSISFAVAPGEFFGIVGRNGSGK